MSESKPYYTILQRDGTSSRQRKETVLLQPDFFKPDERSLEDIYNFARSFASKINFYEFESFENNPYTDTLTIEDCKDGNWSSFLEEINFFDTNKNDFDPHLALYIAFLKLFSHAQSHINQFTEKHIDFYYKNVLGLNTNTGIRENAHVIFELAKNANEIFIEKGTRLDAGKINNQPAVYTVSEDTVVNKATVAQLKTVYINEEEKDVIRFAAQTDTSDGISKQLKAEQPYYDAFGLQHIDEATIPKAKIGFAIASPMLLLKDGVRIISITLHLSNIPTNLKNVPESSSIELFFTGEKSWLGGYISRLSYGNFTNNRQTIKISYELAATEPSVTAYNPAVHKNNFNTIHPLVQIFIDTTRHGNIYGYLANAVVENISIDVDVKGVTALTLENDAGSIDSKKPFYPFGTVPKKGSSFTVFYDELMHKKITEYQFAVDWLGAPESFATHYMEYGAGITNNSFKAKYKTTDGAEGTTVLFNSSNPSNTVNWPTAPFIPVWFSWGAWLSPITYNSFHSLYSNPNYINVILQSATISTISNVQPTVLIAQVQKGFIRFELSQSFLHERYGKVFAEKAIAEETLPNEPYTPTIKNISLHYKAVITDSDLNNISFDAFNKKEVQFFHINVFGQSEQHAYLKTFAAQTFSSSHPPDNRIYLFPDLSPATFYIGLKDAQPGQSVSLLFQLAVGTSDPDADTAVSNWSVLCSNEWRTVSGREILKNETNHLQQPGIIRIVIPSCATTDNTTMPEGFIWLRLSLEQTPGTACLFEKVLAQAVPASFLVSENDIHSGAISAGSITKPVNKIQSVKQLIQPYASFGGKNPEDQTQFKLRISERLRHKQRGVTNWDYEHIVLQQFPELYKVKCLNHFNDQDACCKDNAPGFITLIVVPDISNKNFYTPLQPKVNTRTRQQVKDFLQPLVSFFTTIYVVNPDYETILLDFKVRFITAGDFGLYSDKLNIAIKNYLTPWAFDGTTTLHFGGSINKSVLLNFIEEQPYVDFVTELQMYHIDENGSRSADLDTVIISNPKAIMVSASQHNIKEFTTSDICT